MEASDPAAAELARQIKDKNATHTDRRAAAIAILDRAGLRPTDKLEISGPGGGPIQSVDLSKLATDELEALLRISERLKKSAATDDAGLAEEEPS